ncbi:hypothetical protein QUH67_22030 [Bradyrhizobium roseum]|nr:hypothetical protein [Bradyrhizobium roseus]WKA26279.1 hypothetical protein QUH67_22030 [Bradyrhizobium roseus]
MSTRGVLYNSRIFDCIPVFTRYCADAYEIPELIAGNDAQDPFSRVDANRIELGARLPEARASSPPLPRRTGRCAPSPCSLKPVRRRSRPIMGRSLRL